MRKLLKPIIFTMLACTFLLGAGMSAQAASKVAINDENFAWVVKDCAEEADTNKDGYRSEKEASKVKKLWFNPAFNVESFKGIEYFTDVERFVYKANIVDEEVTITSSMKKVRRLWST